MKDHVLKGTMLTTPAATTSCAINPTAADKVHPIGSNLLGKSKQQIVDLLSRYQQGNASC